ncbi:hypothetical protein NQ318_018878 [Aromia moschata]|uniref:Laminin EGF-like domain-containing protein n=1 Tax=Aromia moschata TaxID=1265417 RepID=A0AAV8ZFW3_9CUCU|nr:hypothetical protein NQ318_018878 [Aromia moschata]
MMDGWLIAIYMALSFTTALGNFNSGVRNNRLRCPGACFPGVECKETVGGPLCGACPTGYEGDGFTCRQTVQRCDQCHLSTLTKLLEFPLCVILINDKSQLFDLQTLALATTECIYNFLTRVKNMNQIFSYEIEQKYSPSILN